MAIYEKVKDACGEKGISVLQLEKTLNFARSSICKWNTNTPSVDKVASVAKELNKSIEYFLQE